VYIDLDELITNSMLLIDEVSCLQQ